MGTVDDDIARLKADGVVWTSEIGREPEWEIFTQHQTRSWGQILLALLVAPPIAAGILLGAGYLILPAYLVISMFLLEASALLLGLLGALGGATWGVAISTWLSKRNAMWIAAAGLFSAAVYALAGLHSDLFAGWHPIYGAILAVSAMSAALDQPTVHRTGAIVAALVGMGLGVVLLRTFFISGTTSGAWLAVVVIHGIAASTCIFRARQHQGNHHREID